LFFLLNFELIYFFVEFQYDPDKFDVTPELQEVFDWDGCFIVR